MTVDTSLAVANPDKTASDVTPTVATTPGQVLAQARQKQGWSIGDIAAKLRMSVGQIDALEKGDYARLPTGTFLRGFVRSYSKAVHLDADSVLSLLNETHPASRNPNIVVPTQNIKLEMPGDRFDTAKTKLLLGMAILVAAAAGGAYWWLQIRPQVDKSEKVAALVPVKPPLSTPPVAVPDPVPPPADAATSASSPLVAEQPAVPVAAPLTQSTAPLVTPEAVSAQVPKPAVPKGSGSLRFSFSGESWVEVVEASGKTLISRRYQAGESETVVGKLPMSVIIGNATVTNLQFNDVAFDLAPHTRVAVARFTLK